jgi:hypothetical protein
MQVTKQLVVLLAATSVVELVTAKPQLKLGFLEDGQHAARIHTSGRISGSEADDGTAPLIPQMHAADMPNEGGHALMDEPEGGTAPLIPQHTVEWKAESAIPASGQFFIASAWVLMLGSIPFILPIIDNQKVTKTQMILGGSMCVVIFGGFYLFTNIILFQSVHFKRIRPLTTVECIYFMAQVITTVGYGDITPAKIRGQVFVGLYVLGALFVIAMLISDLTTRLVIKAKEYRQKLAAQKAEEVAHTPRPEGGEGDNASMITIESLVVPEKPSYQPLITAALVFGVLDLIWVAFFSLHPGEGKTVFQALYMSVITLSTVGFGYFTPITESGMVFGAFMMLFGSSALVNLISNFTALMVKLNDWERFNEGSKAAALDSLKGMVKGSSEVTEVQFMQFALLQMGYVQEAELQNITQAFDNLKPKNGKITLKSVQDTMAVQEEPATKEVK